MTNNYDQDFAKWIQDGKKSGYQNTQTFQIILFFSKLGKNVKKIVYKKKIIIAYTVIVTLLIYYVDIATILTYSGWPKYVAKNNSFISDIIITFQLGVGIFNKITEVITSYCILIFQKFCRTISNIGIIFQLGVGIFHKIINVIISYCILIFKGFCGTVIFRVSNEIITVLFKKVNKLEKFKQLKKKIL